MAKLLKERARNPIIGAASVGASFGTDGFCLSIYPPSRDERAYYLSLTRAEMLTVVSSWLGLEADSVRRDEKANRAACSSSTNSTDKP